MTDLELIEEAARSVGRQTHGVVSFAFTQFARNIHNMNKERTEKSEKQITGLKSNKITNPFQSKLNLEGNTK